MRRWRESGLTAGEFARRHGINVHTLQWWKWRLGAVGAEGAPRSPAESLAPLTFVEMTGALASEPMELVLGTGVRVRLPPSFETDALERLLDVLARRS